MPESAARPRMQERRLHQERQSWKDTESPESFWDVIRMPQVWGHEGCQGYQIQKIFWLGLILSLSWCCSLPVILTICSSSQSFTLSLGFSVLICNTKRLDWMTSKFSQNSLTQIFWVYSCRKANENLRVDFMVLDILVASIVFKKIRDSGARVIFLLRYLPLNISLERANKIIFPRGVFR